MVRKDVMRQADKLSAVSGLDKMAVYDFLSKAGKAIGKNPSLLHFCAVDGLVYLDGDEGDFSLSRFVPDVNRSAMMCHGFGLPDYEELILARQEAYYDD